MPTGSLPTIQEGEGTCGARRASAPDRGTRRNNGPVMTVFSFPLAEVRHAHQAHLSDPSRGLAFCPLRERGVRRVSRLAGRQHVHGGHHRQLQRTRLQSAADAHGLCRRGLATVGQPYAVAGSWAVVVYAESGTDANACTGASACAGSDANSRASTGSGSGSSSDANAGACTRARIWRVLRRMVRHGHLRQPRTEGDVQWAELREQVVDQRRESRRVGRLWRLEGSRCVQWRLACACTGANSNTRSGSNSGSNAITDTDTGTDTGTGSDSNSNAGTSTSADTNTDSRTYACASTDADASPNANADTDTDASPRVVQADDHLHRQARGLSHRCRAGTSGGWPGQAEPGTDRAYPLRVAGASR